MWGPPGDRPVARWANPPLTAYIHDNPPFQRSTHKAKTRDQITGIRTNTPGLPLARKFPCKRKFGHLQGKVQGNKM